MANEEKEDESHVSSYESLVGNTAVDVLLDEIPATVDRDDPFHLLDDSRCFKAGLFNR